MAQPSSLLTHVTQTIINRFHPKRIMVSVAMREGRLAMRATWTSLLRWRRLAGLLTGRSK
jgi:hypothetical protein